MKHDTTTKNLYEICRHFHDYETLHSERYHSFLFLHASVSMFLDETWSFLFFYFGNVFLYEFLALSDDHDVICYSLFFCVILFLFIFFYYFAFSVVYVFYFFIFFASVFT